MHANSSYSQIKFNLKIQKHVSASSHSPQGNALNVTECYKSVWLSFLGLTMAHGLGGQAT